DFAEPPVSLIYKPIHGEPFTLTATVPISLQVSWKIHQTLVRPRFKDLFDLIYLLQHPSFDEQARETSFRALINECEASNVGNENIGHFFYHEFTDLLQKH